MPPTLYVTDCREVRCTWPCEHHLHLGTFRDFNWYPNLEQFNNSFKTPEVQLELKVGRKDCQFCGIFFTIWQSACSSGANADHDHILESRVCRFERARCWIQKNGQVFRVEMIRTCGVRATYELGLATGKVVWPLYDGTTFRTNLFDPSLAPARAFPEILPCMGDLYHNPACDESLALMKGWIDDCQRHHELCMKMHRQQVGLRRPKRLLECLSDGSVRLVETPSRTQRCDYIALSYCWGDGTAVMKTMEATVVDHQRGIPDESLPPLYREVVALARGFNTCLWIDSLCIIQDSENDKKEEVMKMSDIYRGALVVVVSAWGTSPLDSLLGIKPQSGQTHTWRTASLISYQEMDLDVKFRKRHKRAHYSHNAIAGSPIAKRAWCFQEKMLASRCLVFCEDEVVWECQSCCLCGCGGKQEHFIRSGWSPSALEYPYRKMLLPLAKDEPFQLDGTGTVKYFADAKAAYSFWDTAVNDYSRRALTWKTDRLPAISAVSSIVAEATGDRYLAGLWRGDLLIGLAWRAREPPEHDPRPHWKYIAPTWSWASRPTGASFPLGRSRDISGTNLEASVLDAWTVLEGQNPYGSVSDAAIVLSGFHCDAELTISERAEHGHNAELDFGHDDVQKVHLSPHLGALDCIPVEPDTDVDRIGGKPRYLRRITDRQTRRQPACSGTVHLFWLKEYVCLILTPSCRRKGAFERLGFFQPYCHLKNPKTAQRSSITLV